MTCLLAVLTTEITKDPFMFWRLPIILVSTITLSVMVISTISPNYLFDGRWLFGLFILGWVASLITFRKGSSHRIESHVATPIAMFSCIFSIWAFAQPWDPIEGFLKIAQFGEDNGAWLNNIAFSITDTGSQIGPQSSVSGGVLLGVLSSLGALIIRASQNGNQPFDSSAVVLWRLYLLLILLGVVAAISTVIKLVKAKNTLVNILLGTLAVSTCSAYMMGLIGPGYFTALIAVVWLLYSFELLTFGDEIKPRERGLILTWLVLNLVAVGEAWFPINLVGLTMAAIILIHHLSKFLAPPHPTLSKVLMKLFRLQKKTKVGSVLAFLLTVFIVRQFLRGTFVQYISNPIDTGIESIEDYWKHNDPIQPVKTKSK
jgi:hypothetical protein